MGLGVVELAKLARVSTNTIVRFERGESLKETTTEHLRTVLEDAGIEFIPENGGGPGVRLAKRQSIS